MSSVSFPDEDLDEMEIGGGITWATWLKAKAKTHQALLEFKTAAQLHPSKDREVPLEDLAGPTASG